MRYIFYDTETTGLNPAFDQILQFAAIEADEDLNEVSSINIRCRILPYIVPSPKALLVTRVSPTTLVSSNHSYLEMIQQIRTWMGQRTPSMVIGHNSIEFDEPFLRQALYQTLHPVYLTNTGGNSRGDTMRIAQAASIFAPSRINVPLSDKGKPTFRLGPLTRENAITFDETDAHDALADVRATLELARMLRRNTPEIWEQMLVNSSKKGATEFMKRTNYFCSAEFSYGNSSSHLVSAIAANPQNDTQMAAFDMAYDPKAYFDASAEEILGLMKGPGRVIRVVAANKQPMVFDTSIGHAMLDSASFAPDVLTQHVREIRGASEFRQRVAEALTRYYEPEEPSEYIEKRIYGGFPSRNDTQLMEQYHRTPLEAKLTICDQFEDSRFREFGLRLIYSDNPDNLSAAQRDELQLFFNNRMTTTEEVEWMTLPKALTEVDKLKNDSVDQALLLEIEHFLINMRKTANAG